MEEHIISETGMDRLQEAIQRNRYWMAYNSMSYFLQDHDMYFFKKPDEAEEFASNNISDRDYFNVIKVDSVENALKKIIYGAAAGDYLAANEEKHLQQLLSNYLITHKNSVMNEKNYEYLTEQLKRTGFEDTLNEELRKNMEKQNPEFTLNMQKDYGTDNIKAALHFKKSDESDMFFFNRYDMELKKENGDTTRQTFYPDKNITLKEGYNLLDGRAVHKTLTSKEHEKYTAWLQLDFKNTTQSGNNQFKQYHQNYGFDLEQTLAKYPIKELQNEKFKESLVRSLERGNLQSATFQINGKEEKIFLTPNVAFKALSAFDDKGQKISLSELMQKNKQEQTVQTMQPENKQETAEKQSAKKASVAKEDKEAPAQKKTKRQKIA